MIGSCGRTPALPSPASLITEVDHLAVRWLDRRIPLFNCLIRLHGGLPVHFAPGGYVEGLMSLSSTSFAIQGWIVRESTKMPPSSGRDGMFSRLVSWPSFSGLCYLGYGGKKA